MLELFCYQCKEAITEKDCITELKRLVTVAKTTYNIITYHRKCAPPELLK